MSSKKKLAVALAAAALISLPLASSPLAANATITDQTYVPFTSSTGVASTYHIYSANVATPKGVVVYLDGDGQWGYKHPTDSYALGGSSGIVANAKNRGYATLAVKTPDTTGTATWWENCTRNSDYLKEVLQTVKTKYGVDTSNVWLTGYSGGAQFITQCYLPRYSSTVATGGSVVFGGGGKPNVTVQPFSSALKSSFAMNWYTGADDIAANSPEGYDALAYAKAGYTWYTNAGFKTWSEWPAGINHNTVAGKFGTVIGQRMDAAAVVTPAPTVPTTSTPTPAPTTTTPIPSPSPTTSTPNTAPWATTITPLQHGVTATVTIPSTATGKTYLWVYHPNGVNYWYTYTTAVGKPVTLTINNSNDPLPAGTTYTYKVKSGSTVVNSGSFTTLP